MKDCEVCKNYYECKLERKNKVEKCFFLNPTEEYKETFTKEYKHGYNKAIDDFVEKLGINVESFEGTVNGIRASLMTEDYFHEYVWEIAEQMKGE